ncbi:renin receptor, partial [Mytilus galloprovincialis]
MNKICEIFNSSSISVFGTKCKNQKYAKHNEKPWYKRGCKSKRNLFHQARQRYGNLKSKENKKALKEASKSYKKELNRSYNDFQMNTAKDLRKLAKSDPKRLWQKLNSINTNKSNKTDAVKIEDLYEHFKRLSQDEVIEDNSDIDLTKFNRVFDVYLHVHTVVVQSDCLISQVICQELIVTHAPKYITFQQQADHLQTSDVSKVITHTLGVPTEDVKWSGLNQGSLFNRPKANVLMTVVTAEGKKPLSVKNVAKYPVKS